MLDLHDIKLRPHDKQTLQKLCETRSNQIKYKDALALIQVNRELNEAGQPLRQSQGLWILQIPRKHAQQRKHASLNASEQRSNADAMSVVSNMSFASDVSIDPVVRQRAEKIMEYNASRLEVINEERQTPAETKDTKRLTAGKLKVLADKDGEEGVEDLPKSYTVATVKEAQKSPSLNRERLTKMSRFSKFEEKSLLDQDDSYGNYKPKFQTKNYKVTGRTGEVMKLQRIASLDHQRALLAPIQPDLSR